MFATGPRRGAQWNLNPKGGTTVTIVWILIVIVLVLLAIYLFQRVR
jgi:hypothetical protein